jgi:hypothetical protein
MEPGQIHPEHTDEQNDAWITRIHAPLITNERVFVRMADGDHYLKVGSAYQFNTLAWHGVYNLGKTPRVHFVLDVRRSNVT